MCIYIPFSTKRLNELRQSVDFDSMIEKEGELQEFEKDPLLPMIISDKDRDVGGSTLTKIISDKDRDDGGSTLTANYTKKKKEDTRSVGDGKVVNGGGVRSGASSPSPSVGTYLFVGAAACCVCYCCCYFCSDIIILKSYPNYILVLKLNFGVIFHNINILCRCIKQGSC